MTDRQTYALEVFRMMKASSPETNSVLIWIQIAQMDDYMLQTIHQELIKKGQGE